MAANCSNELSQKENSQRLVPSDRTSCLLHHDAILLICVSQEETKFYFIQLFNAVKYLHEQDVAHRDLKV